MKTKLILILLLFILINIEAYANDFLLISSSARASSMAEAISAFPEDADIMNYNPAGLAVFENDQLSLTYIKWFAEMNYENISYARNLGPRIGVAGINFKMLHYPGFEVIRDDGTRTGEKINEFDTAIAIGLGRKITFLKNSFGGINIRMINSRLADYSRFSLGLDAGLLSIEEKAIFIFRNIKTSVALRDLMIDLKNDTDSDAPSLAMMAFGLSSGLFDSKKSRLSVAMELAKKVISQGLPEFKIGAEYSFKQRLYLRAGYKIDRSASDLCFGIGLNINQYQPEYPDIGFDYTMVPYKHLENVHVISFIMKFHK